MKKLLMPLLLALVLCACGHSLDTNEPAGQTGTPAPTAPAEALSPVPTAAAVQPEVPAPTKAADLPAQPEATSPTETPAQSETATPAPTPTIIPEPVYDNIWMPTEIRHFYNEWGLQRTSTYTYDEEGRLSFRRLEYPGSAEETTYTYNENGYIATVRTYSFDGDGFVLFDEDQITVAYNKDGLIESEVMEKAGIRRVYVYDDNGLPVSLTETSAGAEKKYRFAYDGSGRLVKTALLSGSTEETVIFNAYDAHGFVSSHFDSADFEACFRKVYSRMYVSYPDSKERPADAKVYDYYRPDRLIGKETYTYDDDGNRILTVIANMYGEQTERIEETYSLIRTRVQ